MCRPRFGELLGRFVALTPHDISEILEEQVLSQRRFGEVALSMGLCKPQHVWRAWWTQLSGAPERVNLDEMGIDAQCLAVIPPAMASQYSVIPLRASGDQVVVAAAEGALMRAMEELPRLLKKQLKFVLADPRQIRHAIEKYYPPPTQDPEESADLAASRGMIARMTA